MKFDITNTAPNTASTRQRTRHRARKGKRECDAPPRVKRSVMVDVSHIPEVKVGDEVVVMGKQGKDEITAHDLGRWTNTFAYEIMTRMGKRLPIVYKQRAKKSRSSIL